MPEYASEGAGNAFAQSRACFAGMEEWLSGAVAAGLVGSAALWLHGEPIAVGDADVVVEPVEQNLCRLGEVLAQLALRPRAVPPVRDLALLHLVSVTTSYGGVDCLLERGRLDWERLRKSAVTIAVADAGVRVAARADAWALRRRFKG